MEETKEEFSKVLLRAQKLGYAEPINPKISVTPCATMASTNASLGVNFAISSHLFDLSRYSDTAKHRSRKNIYLPVYRV